MINRPDCPQVSQDKYIYEYRVHKENEIITYYGEDMWCGGDYWIVGDKYHCNWTVVVIPKRYMVDAIRIKNPFYKEI